MNAGMLWLIDDPKMPMAKSILAAADYYLKKYGKNPDLCLVNMKNAPADGEELEFNSMAITVRLFKGVVPGHLWICVEDQAGRDIQR